MYDETGSPCGFIYNGTPYYYIMNLQGDVIQVRDAEGTVQAEYKYNAWGEILSSSSSLASINPIRYRGYYYDAETGLYCVGRRYYDPITSRFISADSYASTGQGFLGLNMFAYCVPKK
ncbi:MAG: RHS repeat-associated core domain-containing protein [Oscillospiraceae bacterium]|nr:RHS repeat-associated core domain-containing protein [Oscillospiraceae bacterium]